jgi:hypothetical protein
MGVGRWYMLNTIVLGYVLCGNVGVLYAYMYISFWRAGASNVQYIYQ